MLVVAIRVHRAPRPLGERINFEVRPPLFRRPTSGQLKDVLVAVSHGYR